MSSKLKEQDPNKVGKDVVILHMFERSRVSPNPSPYPIKFETYLRMADIKYVPEFKHYMSSKGKSPWMTFNGKDMADSQLCMEYLAKTLDKDLSAHLSSEEKSIARGMRAILEDHFYFCLVMERWAYSDIKFTLDTFPPLPVPGFLASFVLRQVGKGVQKQAHAQGIGRHTKEEVQQMGLQDLKSISDYLGKKPFMMGERPTELDCVVFGFIVQLIDGVPNDCVYKKALGDELSNLKEHYQRMKDKYWPDWDECCYRD